MKEGDRERVFFLYERQIVADEEGFLGDILGRRAEETDAKRKIFRESRGKRERRRDLERQDRAEKDSEGGKSEKSNRKKRK